MNPIFALPLEEWYVRNGRNLPWRATKDAYRIWVSEIILQQTRVEQGRAYYERFVERFPSVDDLARAAEDEVLQLWQGLGYYSRARNMRAAAQQVVAMGSFPQTYKDLLALKGVGEYTAAAIASFAFDEPKAVVDGNVYRVLSRYTDDDTPIDSTQGKRFFAELAQEMMDEKRPALYNQAIMDFGALHCRIQNPLCDTCPLADTCLALANHTTDERPVKMHRTRVVDRFFTYVQVEDEQGRLLLQRREAADIWQGLYQFPLIESEHQLSINELQERLAGRELCVKALNRTHQLSHQRLHADFYALRLDGRECPFEGQWVARTDLSRFALPRLLTRFLEGS